jgi:DNA-binding beta-propeller fold protein YncE
MNRRQFVVGATSLVLAPRALAGGVPLALVTADRESRLVVLELSGGHVRAYIPTLASPRSIESVGETAVVAHSEGSAVSLVRRLKVLDVVHGFEEPRYTAGHPDGRHAYVTDAARGEVVALDVVRGRITGRGHVGSRARHLSISPNGRRLWVALGSKAREVAIVDLADRAQPRLSHTFRPPFRAHDVSWAPDGRHAWVSSGDREQLAVYDVRTGRLVARPDGDFPPQHVTFADGRAYVTSGWSGTVRVHTPDGRELRRNPIPVGSYNVQSGWGVVLTPSLDTGTLTVLDRAGRTRYRAEIARSSHDACVMVVAN